MKKLFLLTFLLPLTACKKSSTTPLNVTPDITESLSLSIVNQNPDSYDSARGHVSDTFSWSVPNAYGDTCITYNGAIGLPPNATTLMVESLVFNYGTDFSYVGENWLYVNQGTMFNTVGLTIGFPDDTANLSIGYPYTGGTGGNITYADTVAADRPTGFGLSRMLDWWSGTALPINDTVINYNVDINTYSLEMVARDTLTFTSKGYIGDEFVVSGTFSERIFTELGYTYEGSNCLKSWYVKGTFSNLIYVFTPD
jgi:hypothetical protein